MADAHPPAWYEDPRAPGLLRRWNGTSWTDDVRPLPGWMQDLRPAAGPAATRGLARRPRLARRLWTASTVTLVSALVLLLSLTEPLTTPPGSSPDRVRDERFVSGAVQACMRANRGALGRYRDEESVDAADRERLVLAVERLAGDLAEVDVDDADEAAVRQWLRAWDAWTVSFHGRLEAEATGDRTRAARLERELAATRADLNRFSYANGLTPCLL